MQIGRLPCKAPPTLPSGARGDVSSEQGASPDVSDGRQLQSGIVDLSGGLLAGSIGAGDSNPGLAAGGSSHADPVSRQGSAVLVVEERGDCPGHVPAPQLERRGALDRPELERNSDNKQTIERVRSRSGWVMRQAKERGAGQRDKASEQPEQTV